MIAAPLPDDDASRLCRLEELALLDTAGEAEFDALTRLASAATGMPIALVSLVDRNRQWFKSAVGLPQGAQTGRDESFCGHAIAASDEIFEVEDAPHDPRFFDNPLVTGAPHVVHYAGAPLVMPGGERIGTFCLISRQPGRLQPHERVLLKGLAESVVGIILMRERELALQLALARQNAELESALLRAQAANRAKDDFLATMSHELRTPLNGILGYAQLLEETLPDPDQRKQVRYIRETGETPTRILNDVLDIAKIEAGKFDLDPRPFEMSQVFESCTSLFAVLAADKGLAFETRLEVAEGRLVGDPVRLRQLMHNLLSNAFKFTSRGRVALRVSQDPSARLADGRQRTMTRIEVEDSGVGMSEEQLGRLFQRLEQASASTAVRYGGTGLGLAIVKALVERMEGEVAVQSRLGEGSRFTLTIPFDVAQALPAASEKAPPGAAPERPLHVLVVDDLPMNRHVLRALLERRGHRVSEAEDGVQAIGGARELAPDLVLMDLDMPQMDGLEATRQIRSLPGSLSEVPIYALTGKAFAEDIERTRQAGMQGHLAKPVQMGPLVQALQAVARAG